MSETQTSTENSKFGFLKKIMGKNLYSNIRSRYLFRDTTSPFPLYQETAFDPDWDKFLDKTEHRSAIGKLPLIYLVSPTQRSGTNFLSHILDHHSRIQYPTGDQLPNEHCIYSYSEFLKRVFIQNSISME